jgi:hypothetical protein
VAINPMPVCYAGLGMTYLVGDGDPAADRCAGEGAPADPDNLDAVMNLALLYIRTGRADATKLIDGPLADEATAIGWNAAAAGREYRH